MSLKIGPYITTSGLVACLDAADRNSYSGSGSTWKDVSGNDNNGTLFNSPTFSSDFCGVFSFDGSTNYITVPSLNYSSGKSTVICAARYNGSIRGRMVNALSNNWLIGHWNSTPANSATASTENYYAASWVTSIGSGSNDTNWRVYGATSDTVSDEYKIYVNGSLKLSNANGSSGPNGIAIGKYGGGSSEYSNGQVSFVLVYNRILTETEITLNFNSVRDRFSI